MTGPGLHLWQNGERVTAGDIYAHVERQGFMTFASAKTRDASYYDPVEGAISYLKDIDEYQVFDGVYWRTIWTLATTYMGPFTGSLASTTLLAAGGTTNAVNITTAALKKDQWYWAAGMLDIYSANTSYVTVSGSLYSDGVQIPGRITGTVDDQNRTVFSRQWVWKHPGTTGSSKTVRLVAVNHDGTNSVQVVQSHTRLVVMALGVTSTEAVY